MSIEIDGSVLEGGGQILRSAIAFAAVLDKPVIVNNIRAKRKTTGLRPQHLHGILAIKELTKAHVKGTHEGSTRIEFIPQTRCGGAISVEIGTAGAITLVLQTIMIVAPFCQHPVTVTLRGGTNVAWSPPIDYMQQVFLPRLQQMGFTGTLTVTQRGYYPRGGGQVNAHFIPVKELVPLNLEKERHPPQISGISHCGSLPRHVAERQAKAATDTLAQKGYHIDDVKIEHIQRTLSPGSGITLVVTNNGNRLIGTDALGKRGLRAEKVGEQAAVTLIQEIKTQAPVDSHQADMLIPYAALANGPSSFFISTLTMHTITNIHVAHQFLDIKFNVKGKTNAPAQISVNGIGLVGEPVSLEPSENL